MQRAARRDARPVACAGPDRIARAQIGKWHAQIDLLGYFDIEEDAARVYDAALVAYKSKPTVQLPREAARAPRRWPATADAGASSAGTSTQLRQDLGGRCHRGRVGAAAGRPSGCLHDKYEELLRVPNDAALLLWTAPP